MVCSIDPASDSVITCKYLPISRHDKQAGRASRDFDELCSLFSSVCTVFFFFFFAPPRHIAHKKPKDSNREDKVSEDKVELSSYSRPS